MKFIRRFSKYLESVEGALVALALLSMIFLASFQVLVRNWEKLHKLLISWDINLMWIDPVVRLLVIWLGFLGASMATHERGHIRLDLVSKFLPERFRHLSLCLVHFFSAVVCYFLTTASLGFLALEKEFSTTITEGLPFINALPTHWGLAVVPFGFIVMGARFLMLGLEDLLNFLNPPPAAANSENIQKGAAI